MVEELKACIASAHDIKDTRQDCDVSRFLRDHGQALVEAAECKERYEFIRENFTLVIKGTGVYVELLVPYGKDGWTLDHYIDLARTKASAGETE